MPVTLDGKRIRPMKPLSACIYGSCVSRDLVEICNSTIECTEYIARQSWISALNRAHPSPSSPDLSSSFQREMVVGDLRSNAITKILEALPVSDVLIMDLVDERFGVLAHAEGFATPSAEFSASGMREDLGHCEHIPFGTDVHFDLWQEAATKLRDTLSAHNSRTIVLNTPFTSSTVDGSPVPDAREKSSAEWNQLYERYYLYLVEIGLPVIRLPTSLCVSTPYHRWGPAPFHYVEAAYIWLRQHIDLELFPDLE